MFHCPAGTREDAHNAHKKTTSKRKKNATLIAKKMQATLTVNAGCKKYCAISLAYRASLPACASLLNCRICAIQPAYSQSTLHCQHDLHNIFCNLTCIFCKQTCTSMWVAQFVLQFFLLSIFCVGLWFFCAGCGQPSRVPAGQ